MTTSARVAANQVNAQRSTGPKTPEGKAISAQNNFRHGFSGAFTVLPWGDQNEFDMLLGSLRDEHKPSGLTEMILVDKMAQAIWLSKRALMLQHVTFNHELPVCDDEKQLALYLRYQTTNERAFHKCLNDLLKVRAEKRKQEIGFESQKHKQADQTRREAGENRKQELHRWNVLLAEAKLDHQLLDNSTDRSSNGLAACKEETSIGAQQAA
jgi:choline dehydrogenase-like flavoprotein